MWSGTNIPSGYALCDGKNGTPNLVNKFIIGSGGNYKIVETGGNEKIKLSVNQLPPHNHNFMQNIFVNQVMMIQYMLYLAVVMIGIIQARKYTQLIQLEMGLYRYQASIFCSCLYNEALNFEIKDINFS